LVEVRTLSAAVRHTFLKQKEKGKSFNGSVDILG
jgi:hypothetical protein